MNYSNFNLEDFVMDEKFQTWVKNPDAKSNKFWEEFLKLYPEKQEMLDEAYKIIKSITFKKYEHTEEDYLDVLDRILEAEPQQNQRKFMPKTRIYQSMAAALALLLTVSLGIIYFSQTATQSYVTLHGKTKTIKLEDGSKVYLNANSSLKTNGSWKNGAPREVWLEGEAYFEVSKSPDKKQKFIVHTKDLDVVVLGTKFNVQDRRGVTQVVLNSGKVQLNINHPKAKKEILMKPGEMIEYSRKDQKINQTSIDKDIYSTWKENRLIFDDMPLWEVAQAIEDVFGYKVNFRDSSLTELRFTGATPADDLDLLLEVLESTFTINIQKSNKEILIQE